MHPDTDVCRPTDQEVRAISRGKLIKPRTKRKRSGKSAGVAPSRCGRRRRRPDAYTSMNSAVGT